MPTWDDRMPVTRSDPDAFLFMGADPAWTPTREFKLADAPDAAAGQCSECGGDAGLPLLDADDLPILDHNGKPIVLTEVPVGSHRVCGRCMRSGKDQRSQGAPGSGVVSDPDVPVACPDDPGYVERDGVRVPERFARLMKG
jgi:hypothetical protein